MVEEASQGAQVVVYADKVWPMALLGHYSLTRRAENRIDYQDNKKA